MLKLCLFIALLFRFGLLSDYLLGNSRPLGWPCVLNVFGLYVIFIYFPFWFLEQGLALSCSSSCSLLFYYVYIRYLVENGPVVSEKSRF